jgi:predicted acyl esterase
MRSGGEAQPSGAAELEVESVLNHLPLDDHPLLRELAPFYFDWLDHPTADTYWHPISPCVGYEQIGAPALNFTGWYDIFLGPTLQNYQGMRIRGGSQHARRNQRLIIGSWSHSTSPAASRGASSVRPPVVTPLT